MDYLQARRIDVHTAEQLDRYEQLFDIPMSHTMFGMGDLQSVAFLQFLTLEDVCTLRSACFAIGVELHDVMETMALSNMTLVNPPRGGLLNGFCWLL